MIFLDKFDQKQLNGFTLVIPSVSVGNVGQLTIDLLISSLPTKKIGIVHHPAIHAMVGGDPYNPKSKEVTTSADLHLVQEHSLVILQIRSPLIKHEKQKFLEELVAWCKNTGIKDVVMLASCNAYERWDSQISGTQLRYYINVPESCEQMLRSVGAAELEERTDEFGKKHRFLSGAGFVQPFMDICELPVATLIKFVDEGDNRGDAYALATYLNAWKHLFKVKCLQMKPIHLGRPPFLGGTCTGVLNLSAFVDVSSTCLKQVLEG
ncbi:proteasome assembly chaperone 2-like [Penaeus japonicus]|uniref:proteasome assembly chaperone 2-like n=1 Tax=Penaeus japonicus TaxID=27405 RepID=UPI001C710852|nr:proteasome assembly chaperone 2-like [Penaeus japonicus]